MRTREHKTVDALMISVILVVFIILSMVVDVHCQAIAGVTHVVVIVSENQSGDSLCPAFPVGFDCATTGTSKTLGLVPLTHRADPPLANCGHGYSQALSDIDNGLMDGFSRWCPVVNGVNQAYTQLYATDIPWLSALANNQIAGMPTMTQDRMFESEPDPSWGSHLFLIAATDANVIGLPTNSLYWGCNAPTGTTVLWKNPVTHTNSQITPCVNPPTIMTLAKTAGVSLSVYGPVQGQSGGQWVSPTYVSDWFYGPDWSNVHNMDNFVTDWADPLKRAQITYLIPRMADSGHPKASMHNNEAWIKKNLEALQASPDWPGTVVILVWDDWGGWYDHVVPPKQANGVYKGLRVASMVVSPLLTKAGLVDHGVYDFGSVLKFAEDQFGLGCLTVRDCGAASMNGEFQ